MDTFRLIWLMTIVLSIGVQIIMLSLQAGALRRYGHKSFWLLGAGSVSIAIYAVIQAAPYFFTFSKSALANLLSIALVFGVIGAIFGVSGTAPLFRRFGQLQQAAIGARGETA